MRYKVEALRSSDSILLVDYGLWIYIEFVYLI